MTGRRAAIGKRVLALAVVASLTAHLAGFAVLAGRRDPAEMAAARGGSVSVVGSLEDMVQGGAEELEPIEQEFDAVAPVEPETAPAEPVEAVPPEMETPPVAAMTQVAQAVPVPMTDPAVSPAPLAPVTEEAPDAAAPAETAPVAAAPVPLIEAEPPRQAPDAVPAPTTQPVARPDPAPPADAVPKIKPVSAQTLEPVAEERPKKTASKKIRRKPINRPARTKPTRAKRTKAAATRPKGGETASRRGGDTITSKRGTSNNSGTAQGKAAIGGRAAQDNYKGTVLRRLRQAKRYPADARRARLHGTAVVSFTVSKSGGVSGIRLVRSSGHPILDQAALAMVRRASPMPPIPPGTGRSSFRFQVPVLFSGR